MRKLLIAVLLLASCRGERAEEGALPFFISVRDAAGATFLTVRESEGVVDIALGAKKLQGEPKESGKRKYRIDNGDVAFEVKPGDDLGFKLRRADGSLRWKLKVTADKIKISDNEQNQNPFELKLKEGDRIKVVAPGDRRLGDVRGTRVENAEGKTIYTAEGRAGSAAYGVLLLDAIPAEERAILLAELLSRGR